MANTLASLMSAVRPYTCPITACTSSSFPGRSSHGFSFKISIPKELPCPASNPYPATFCTCFTCGICSMRSSIRFITSSVVRSELPAAVLTLTNTTPWSSSGTRLVFVVFISTTSKAMEAIRSDPVSHRRLMKKRTMPLYFSTTTSKAALNALRKRVAKFCFWVPSSLMYGFSSRAQSAGLSVRAFTAEIPTATAIVSPN